MTGEETGPKEVAALYISKQPKIDYFVGDTLDLSEGRFKVLYDDETETEHNFTDQGVENLQAMILKKTGRQKLQLHYQGQTVDFDVLVSPKAAVQRRIPETRNHICPRTQRNNSLYICRCSKTSSSR